MIERRCSRLVVTTGKPSAEVEAHLVAEDAAGAGARAVGLVDPVGHDVVEEVEVLAHARSLLARRRHRAGRPRRMPCPPAATGHHYPWGHERAPLRPGPDRDGHPDARRTARSTRRAPTRSPTTSSTTGNDGLVVNGTTGESPTTTDDESSEMVRPSSRRSATGPWSSPASAPTTPRHTVELARSRGEAGAHGLLVVTPYYNKPPQAGLIAHFTRSPTPPSCR